MIDNLEKSPEQQVKTLLVYDTADPFEDVEYDKNAPRKDNSGFFDQEEIVIETKEDEPELEFDFKPSVPAPTKAKAKTQDDNQRFFIPALDLLSENKPITTTTTSDNSISSYTPAPTASSNSYANYQIASAARAGNRRKQPNVPNRIMNRTAVVNKKPEILAVDNDDIGEVISLYNV